MSFDMPIRVGPPTRIAYSPSWRVEVDHNLHARNLVMKNIPSPFSFENHSIRTVIIDNEIWFVAKDIAEALEYSTFNTRLIDKIPSEWKGVKQIYTLGGKQPLNCLSEQGMYIFISRSDKPKALPFQKWVAGEVLPQIRKTGQYQVGLSDRAIGADGMSILSSLVNGKISHLKGKQRASAKARF